MHERTLPTHDLTKSPERKKSPEHITPRELIMQAHGRSIIIGETHTDRSGREASIALIREAHQAGYRKLGVEISNEGKTIALPTGKEIRLPGLEEELNFLRSFNGELPETDPTSYMAPSKELGGRPRMNRHWQMQEALRLGWEIIANDPNHWNWMQNTEDGYLHSREPLMAETIVVHAPLVAIYGSAHIGGLSERLPPESAVFAAASITKPENDRTPHEPEIYSHRGDFSRSLPLLVKE